MNDVYYWIQDNITGIINYVANDYWGNSLVIFILFVSCITLLFLNKDKMQRGYGILAVYSVLLIVLVVLNPFALKKNGNIREAFSLLPMCLIISFVIVEKSRDIVSKVKLNAVMIGLAILIVLAGLAIRTEEMVSPNSSCKVYDQGVKAAQIILEDSNNGSVTVCYVLSDGDNRGTDINAYESMLQYSGQIRTFTSNIGEYGLWEVSDYLVLNNELIESGQVALDGYEIIGDAGYYSVLGRA